MIYCRTSFKEIFYFVFLQNGEKRLIWTFTLYNVYIALSTFGIQIERKEIESAYILIIYVTAAIKQKDGGWNGENRLHCIVVKKTGVCTCYKNFLTWHVYILIYAHLTLTLITNQWNYTHYKTRKQLLHIGVIMLIEIHVGWFKLMHFRNILTCIL